MDKLQEAIELFNKRKYDAALFILDEILEKDENDFSALRQKGKIFVEMCQYEKALPYFEKAYELNKTPEYEGELGVCHYLLKQYDKAQIHLIQSVVEKYDDYFARTLEKALLSKHNDDAMLGLKLLMYENNPKDIYILRDITNIAQKLNGASEKPGKCKEIKGIGNIDKIINIDQSPIGRTPRSNPATYTGTFDIIRDIFAGTNEAFLTLFPN